MKGRIKAFWDKKITDKGLYRHTWISRFGVVGTAVMLATPGRANYNAETWWTVVTALGLVWSLYQIWWTSREKKRRGLK